MFNKLLKKAANAMNDAKTIDSAFKYVWRGAAVAALLSPSCVGALTGDGV